MVGLLVTGASGFVGSWLKKRTSLISTEFDITDEKAVLRGMEELCPQTVIHLAGQAHVARSLVDPEKTFAVNARGTQNVVKALQAIGFQGRLLYVSSADVYGIAQELPITEEHPVKPLNPYSDSKVAAEKVCLESDLDVVIARPFNHIGPGQSFDFALPSFARQLCTGVVNVGNLEATRDFTDVRDIVEGYLLLLEKGRSGEIYNLCSGRERSMRQVLDALIAVSGRRVEVRQDPSRLRPAEQPRMVGSSAKMVRDTGWQVSVPFEQSIQNIWESIA